VYSEKVDFAKKQVNFARKVQDLQNNRKICKKVSNSAKFAVFLQITLKEALECKNLTVQNPHIKLPSI